MLLSREAKVLLESLKNKAVHRRAIKLGHPFDYQKMQDERELNIFKKGRGTSDVESKNYSKKLYKANKKWGRETTIAEWKRKLLSYNRGYGIDPITNPDYNHTSIRELEWGKLDQYNVLIGYNFIIDDEDDDNSPIRLHMHISLPRKSIINSIVVNIKEDDVSKTIAWLKQACANTRKLFTL